MLGFILQDPPNKFCSIACKVLIVDHEKPKNQIVKLELANQDISDLSWKENKKSSELSAEEKQSSLSSSDVSEETKTWVTSLKPRGRVQKRKGCPLLPLEMIHYYLRSSESWLSLQGQKNVLLMHCEREGWPILAFMLASLLIYRKQYSDEQKTLEMVYKQTVF